VDTYHLSQDARLDALGDPTRRAILARLAAGPRAVGRLAEEFPVSRPAISQHLRVLREARLVTVRSAGNRRFYSLDPAGFAALRELFDQFWDAALAAFKQAVEQEPGEVSPEERGK
jgi:DNA-binding transcriptional ArsR family regulator